MQRLQKPTLVGSTRRAVSGLSVASRRASIVAVLLILVGSFGYVTPPARAAAPTEFFVEATGHTLGGAFLDYWIDNRGQNALGYPLSEPIQTGQLVSQYFQYGVLEQNADGSITREMAALSLLTARFEPDSVLTRELENTTSSSILMEITSIREISAIGSGHPYPVDPSILDFYHSRGGRAAFGRALAPVDTTGAAPSQWFEYVRVDFAPSGPVLAQVGSELAEVRNIDTTRVLQGDLPSFDPNRYVDYFGDGTIPEADGPFIPSRILIPAIDVDATVEPVGVVGGQMQVPVDEWNVGWYPSMSSPGEWSNVVMAGHKDWWGVGPVVFWNLDKLVPGDRIYVVGPNGAGATYEVTLSWLISSTMPADPLIADTGFEALTLITCDGQWNGSEYTSRRIVRARRI